MEGNKLLKISKIFSKLDTEQSGRLIKAIADKVLGVCPEAYLTNEIEPLYLLAIFTLGIE